MKDLLTCQMISKKKFYCEVAGVVYEIEYSYPKTKIIFKDYIIKEPKLNDRVIKISYDERDIEKIKSFPNLSTDDSLEYACIFDKICSMLTDFDMILMHGAAIEYEGEGFIFTAPSGTGKSTHIAQWKKYLGDKVIVVNGDKPELSFEGNGVLVHGAPWCGKESWQVNKSVPLKGVCLLKRGQDNKIYKINPGEYIEYFVRQFYFDMATDDVAKVFDIIDRIMSRVPFYILECDISEDAAKCSFEAMTGKSWRKDNED